MKKKKLTPVPGPTNVTLLIFGPRGFRLRLDCPPIDTGAPPPPNSYWLRPEGPHRIALGTPSWTPEGNPHQVIHGLDHQTAGRLLTELVWSLTKIKPTAPPTVILEKEGPTEGPTGGPTEGPTEGSNGGHKYGQTGFDSQGFSEGF